MLKRLFLFLIISAALFCTVACGGGQQTSNSGSGSEVVGVVQTDEEQSTRIASRGTFPADNAFIFLFKTGYSANGFESPIEFTNSDGSFSIKDVEPGEWFLEAFDSSSTGNKSRISLVRVSGNGKKIDLDTINIVEPASVRCKIKTDLPVNLKYSIYLLGTRIYGHGDQDSLNLTLSNIPVGVQHTVQLKVTDPIQWTGEQKVYVTSGQVIDISFDLPL